MLHIIDLEIQKLKSTGEVVPVVRGTLPIFLGYLEQAQLGIQAKRPGL